MDFTAHCELWQEREVQSVGQMVCEVFDGKVWWDVLNGVLFLAAP